MNKILLIILAIFSFYSCSKDKQAHEKFANKVWYLHQKFSLDSENEGSEPFIISFGSVVIPRIDSTFALYKKQKRDYKSYYFKNDSLYLKSESDKTLPKFESFAYKFFDKKMTAINKDSSLTLSFVDLTDLTKGKNSYVNSLLYKKIKNQSWYHVMSKSIDGDVIHSDLNPKYYLKSEALFLKEKDYQITSFYKKDSLTAIKIDDNHIYIYDSKEKLLRNKIFYYFKQDTLVIRNSISTNNSDSYTKFNSYFVEIDESLLKDVEDLSIKEKTNCSESLAKINLEQYLKKLDNLSDYKHSLSSIEIYNQEEENCLFYFKVRRYNKEFPSIKNYPVYSVQFTEDDMVKFNKISY